MKSDQWTDPLSVLHGSGPFATRRENWVEAALALVIVMAFFGICVLAPVNLWVLWELRKPEPNMALVQKLMRIYLAVTALEAVLQLTIVVMTRFRLGI